MTPSDLGKWLVAGIGYGLAICYITSFIYLGKCRIENEEGFAGKYNLWPRLIYPQEGTLEEEVRAALLAGITPDGLLEEVEVATAELQGRYKRAEERWAANYRAQVPSKPKPQEPNHREGEPRKPWWRFWA